MSRAGRRAPDGAAATDVRRAIALFLFAGVCLSSLDATAKWLIQDHALLPLLWGRYAGQILVVTPFSLRAAGAGFWRTQRLALHMARSVLLFAITACFFTGLRYVPLAEGSAIMYLAPVFVVLLSQPLLGERPTAPRLAAAAIGFAGVLILARPGAAVFHPAALLLLAAAFMNGLFAILTRRLTGENPHATLFYGAIVGAVALTLALPWWAADFPREPANVVRLFMLGFFAGVGHWFFIRAFSLAPAASLSPFIYLQLIWATIYGAYVFGHVPDAASFVGMAVIVASGLVFAFQERGRAQGS